MARLIPVIVGLALLVSYGVAEGLATSRWRDSGELDRAASRVAMLPKSIGDWEGRDVEQDARSNAVAGIQAGVQRTYIRRGTTDAVTVLLVCGRGGPMSVHTPDVCFAGNGYELQGSPRHHRVEGAEFWAGRFDKSGAAGHESLGILWAWGSDGRWEGSENPRMNYGRLPAVYKLYLIHAETEPDAHPTRDTVLADFARVFLPAARASLFTPNE